MLDETVLTVNEGASFQEVRHVVKQALQKGGETAAFNALETFRKLVAEGVDEHEARKEVTKMIKHSSRENRELKAEDTRGQHKEEHQTRHKDRSRERHEIEPERHGANEIEPERHGLTENEVRGNDDTNQEVRHQRNDDTKPEHD